MMRRLILLIVLSVIVILAKAQYTLKDSSWATDGHPWNCKMAFPTDHDNAGNSKRYAVFVFFMGTGQVNQPSSICDAYGPISWFNGAGDGTVTISNGSHQVIWITFSQYANGSGYTVNGEAQHVLYKIKQRFRIKDSSMVVMGWSAGGNLPKSHVTEDPQDLTAPYGPFQYADQIKAIVDFQGLAPDDNGSNTCPGIGSPCWPDLVQNFAHNKPGGRYLGIWGTADGSRGIPEFADKMNVITPGSGFVIKTSDGHNQLAVDKTFGSAGFTPAVYDMNGLFQNVYQWALRQTDTTLTTGPTVNAGTDVWVGRGQPWCTLIGTATGTGVLHYAWTRITPITDGNFTHANLVDPTNDTTEVRQVDYNGNAANGWLFRLTVTDDNGSSYDEVMVRPYFGPWPISGGVRKVTAADTALINVTWGAGIGVAVLGRDVFFTGANNGWDSLGKFSDMFIGTATLAAALGGSTLGPDSKMFIKADPNYRKIQLNFAAGQITATTGHPCTLMSVGGQTKTEVLSLAGEYANVRITGTGVPGYDGYSTGLYAFRSGTFGIEIDGKSMNLLGTGLSLSGKFDNIEIDEIEVHGNHFAGIQYTSSDPTDTLEGLYIHDNYVHHTHSEGTYGGKTTVPTAYTSYSRITNNIFSYTGSEITQLVNLNHDNIEDHNTLFLSAINRFSPFDENQDFGPSLNPVNGRNQFRDNLVVGASEQLLNIVLSKAQSAAFYTNNELFKINNNALIKSRGFITIFMGYGGADGNAPDSLVVSLDSNIIGQNDFGANEIFNDQRGTNTMQIMRVRDNNFHVQFKNTIRDNTKTTLISDASNADTSGTKVWGVLPNPEFANSGWASDFPYHKIAQYVDTLYRMHKDEGNFAATNQGQPKIYNIGDIVIDYEKYYRCKVNGLTLRMPRGVTDANWELLTWTKPGGGVSYIPPDDLRLIKNSYYQTRGMGITAFSEPIYSNIIKLKFGNKINLQ